ncbi:hypothetical protein [Flavobacterium sp. N2820]|uniref:hypothetical protein n=1 Tax=Flavobacterium sp. N2820 TaxID=2986834 RepID=UPI002225B1C2|nr:hypothetical protein [Flavobacterium sp. N2820]
MVYPVKLLPKTNYKNIETGLEDKCLIRHFVVDETQGVLDDLGFLKDYIIASGGEKQLPDLSTSLFGVFTENDIYFNVINSHLIQYCVPNHNSTSPIYIQDFNIVNNRRFWSILVEKIDNVVVEYDGDEFKATCFISHTPTISNFWHFSIMWYINTEGKYWDATDTSISNSTKRKLKKETRDFLKKFAKEEILSNSVIEEEHYCLK